MATVHDSDLDVVLTEPVVRRPASPGATARWAAAIYIISGVPAGFSVFVLLKLVVRRDPAATAANILGSEGLFRLGFVCDIIGILLVVISVLLLYELFKPVNARRALLVAFFVVIGSAIQALDSLADSAALIMLKGGGGLEAFSTGQAQSLAFALLRMHTLVYNLALVFYGVGFIVLGTLVRQSIFLPRIIGVPLMIDGLGYITFSLATFLSPPFAAHLYPILPFSTAVLGEGSLMLWLLVKGVDAQRWETQAAAAAWLTRSPAHATTPRQSSSK